jgi:hypothetical protein
MLGPRWTRSIPKAGEESAAEAEPPDAPEPVADADPGSELPSGARNPDDGESVSLGSRGTPKPMPRHAARRVSGPAPPARPDEDDPARGQIWKPAPAELPKSAEPISNARTRDVDPDSIYAKPTPIPRSARPSRVSRARASSAQRRLRRSNSRSAGREPIAHSAGLGKATRERDTFEVASMVFGAIIAFFGLWGAIATIGGGIGSAGFVISVIFTLLGLGRLYFGFRGHKPVPGE